MKKITTKELIYIAIFAALTVIGAFIRIPVSFYPVPFSLQTLFVMLAAMLLRPSAAFLSQAIYIMLGLIGLPIFTGGGGIGYVLNPTFGYLIGFAAAAPVCGAIAGKHSDSALKMFFACEIGSLIINAIGIAYMAAVSGLYLGEPITPQGAIYLLLIFIPIDTVKAVAVALIANEIKRRLPEQFY